MREEKFGITSEAREFREERKLTPEQVREFCGEMNEYICGLEASIEALEAERGDALPERASEIEDELKDLRFQLAGMVESLEAIEGAGSDAVIVVAADRER